MAGWLSDQLFLFFLLHRSDIVFQDERRGSESDSRVCQSATADSSCSCYDGRCNEEKGRGEKKETKTSPGKEKKQDAKLQPIEQTILTPHPDGAASEALLSVTRTQTEF